MVRTISARARIVVAAACLASIGIGCETRESAERRAEEAQAESGVPVRGNRPDALMIRFHSQRGTGFSREGWELEMLQLGSDVRLRGSIRAAGEIVPVYGTLPETEYLDFWSWLAGLPLDRFQVVEDSTAADDGWNHRLEVDIVLGPERRIVSRNSWRRTPVGLPWLSELENTMQALAVEYSAATDTASSKPDSTRDAVSEAVGNAVEELDGVPPRDAATTP